MSAVIGIRSRLTTVVAGAQDTAAILAAAVAASIATSPDLAEAQRVPTVVVMLALAAVLTGVSMWVVGHYRLSAVVRFLPYPVISGFLAGTGWLLVRGGLGVMHRSPIGLSEVDELIRWSSFQFLAPGLVLGAFMVLCLRTRINNMAVSLAIIVGTVGFHVVGRSITSLENLEARGWLIGPFPADSHWAPVGPSDLRDADWSVLLNHGLPLVALVTVSIVGLLLNLGGLEEIVDHEIDIDHELSFTGPANVAVGVAGGLVGYHLAGSTILAHHLGVRGRLVPLLIAMMAGLAFFFGADFVALVPRGVAGGVLRGWAPTC